MHFIRAFPIVLIIIIIFGSCFAFADSEWISGSQPLLVVDRVIYSSDASHDYYIENNTSMPLYAYGLTEGGSYFRTVLVSTYPVEYTFYTDNDVASTGTLSSTIYIDGVKYYISTGNRYSTSYNLPYMSSSSVQESINYIFTESNVTSQGILFNITKFIVASNTWLTSIVGTVMANPLLIFILLFYFVGTALGLLFRFRRN